LMAFHGRSFLCVGRMPQTPLPSKFVRTYVSDARHCKAGSRGEITQSVVALRNTCLRKHQGARLPPLAQPHLAHRRFHNRALNARNADHADSDDKETGPCTTSKAHREKPRCLRAGLAPARRRTCEIHRYWHWTRRGGQDFSSEPHKRQNQKLQASWALPRPRATEAEIEASCATIVSDKKAEVPNRHWAERPRISDSAVDRTMLARIPKPAAVDAPDARTEGHNGRSEPLWANVPPVRVFTRKSIRDLLASRRQWISKPAPKNFRRAVPSC